MGKKRRATGEVSTLRSLCRSLHARRTSCLSTGSHRGRPEALTCAPQPNQRFRVSIRAEGLTRSLQNIQGPMHKVWRTACSGNATAPLARGLLVAVRGRNLLDRSFFRAISSFNACPDSWELQTCSATTWTVHLGGALGSCCPENKPHRRSLRCCWQRCRSPCRVGSSKRQG